MEKIISIIADAIKGSEFEGNAYIVGGYVRDEVMGKISNDLDIVVALNKGGIRLAEYLFQKGVSTNPVIFKNFGTAFVLIDHHKVEFVMARQESYRGGDRKPEVEAGSIKDDIFRRDFTINSLLMDIVSREIIDLTGHGIKDINAKIIRGTSDLDKLFSDDPLRMLRGVRFSVQLDFSIEEQTYGKIKQHSPKLKYISWERRRDEFQKIMISPDPVKGIKMLFDLNLIRNMIL